MQLKFIFILILSVIVALFAIQNSAAVPVNFMMYHLEISQALIILISAIIGAIIAFSLGLMKQFSVSKSLKGKDKKIRELETSIANLKIENAEQIQKMAISCEPCVATEPMITPEPVVTPDPIIYPDSNDRNL